MMEGDIAVCSKLNRHVQMKVAERGMNNNSDDVNTSSTGMM